MRLKKHRLSAQDLEHLVLVAEGKDRVVWSPTSLIKRGLIRHVEGHPTLNIAPGEGWVVAETREDLIERRRKVAGSSDYALYRVFRWMLHGGKVCIYWHLVEKVNRRWRVPGTNNWHRAMTTAIEKAVKMDMLAAYQKLREAEKALMEAQGQLMDLARCTGSSGWGA